MKTAKEIREKQLELHRPEYKTVSDLISKIDSLVTTTSYTKFLFHGDEYKNERVVKLLEEYGFKAEIVEDHFDEEADCEVLGGIVISWNI